jgi:hypothetical protein
MLKAERDAGVQEASHERAAMGGAPGSPRMGGRDVRFGPGPDAHTHTCLHWILGFKGLQNPTILTHARTPACTGQSTPPWASRGPRLSGTRGQANKHETRIKGHYGLDQPPTPTPTLPPTLTTAQVPALARARHAPRSSGRCPPGMSAAATRPAPRLYCPPRTLAAGSTTTSRRGSLCGRAATRQAAGAPGRPPLRRGPAPWGGGTRRRAPDAAPRMHCVPRWVPWVEGAGCGMVGGCAALHGRGVG